MRFGFGGEKRPFHTDIRTALVYLYVAKFANRIQQEFAQCRTERVGKGAMHDNSTLIEGIHTALSAIEQLVGNDQVAGSNMLAQATYSTDRDHPFDSHTFERP